MSRKFSGMTDRERVDALLRRERPDRVPLWPFESSSFSCIDGGYQLAMLFKSPELALEAQRAACSRYGWVFVPTVSYASFGAWEFGGDIKLPESEYDQAPSIISLPATSDKDVRNLKKPDISRAGIIPYQIEFYKLSSREKLDNEPFSVTVPALGPFSLAGNIAGPDKLTRWLIRKPDLAHTLLQKATDFVIDMAGYWKEIFGTENNLVFTGEPLSSNQMISPRHFEQFAFPYLKQAYEAFRNLGYRYVYSHVCGEQNKNLELWSRLPLGDPGIISIGHEVDILDAARVFPNQIILGNLDPAVIQTGTPEDIYNRSKEIIEKGKSVSGGFIFSCGCQLPPRAPAENVRMMTRAIEDFGRY